MACAMRASAANRSASAPSNVARVRTGARSAVSSTSSGAPSSSGPERRSRNVWPSSISAPSPSVAWRVSVPLTTTPLRDCGSSSSQPASTRRMPPWVVETRRSGSCSVSTRCPLSTWRRTSRGPRPNRTRSTSSRTCRDDGIRGSSLEARSTSWSCWAATVLRRPRSNETLVMVDSEVTRGSLLLGGNGLFLVRGRRRYAIRGAARASVFGSRASSRRGRAATPRSRIICAAIDRCQGGNTSEGRALGEAIASGSS